MNRRLKTVYRILCSKIVKVVNLFYPATRDIIIVKRDRIGDYILWMGAAQQLRNYYHNRKISLICSTKNYEIASLSGLFDEYIIMDEWSKSFRKVLGFHSNILISPTQSRTVDDELICMSIAAKRKIALKGDTTNNFIADFFKPKNIYNTIIETDRKVMPEIERNALLCNAITNGKQVAYYANLSDLIETNNIREPYYVINLGASSKVKQWPISRFLEVAKYIEEKTHLLCVLIGSASEIEYSKQFITRHSGRTKILTGKTSLKEMISVIGNAVFAITNDTSTVHVCAACDVKSFCVVSGIHYGRFTEYVNDGKRENLPDYIYDFPRECFGCQLNNDVSAILPECLDCINKQEILPCLNRVSSEAVIRRIRTYLIDQGIIVAT